jgi:hypothetical protein
MEANQDTDLPLDEPRPWLDWKPSYQPYKTSEYLNEREQADDAYHSHPTRQPQPTSTMTGIDCLRENSMVRSNYTPGGISATLVTARDVNNKCKFAKMPLKIEYSNKSSFKMHLSKTFMSHPGDDLHVVPETPGHVFRLTANNLGGAEMTIALFQDEPKMQDCTV